MLNTLFNEDDIIEVRCLHKDQVKLENGKYDPAPHMFWGNACEIKSNYKKLKDLNQKGYNIYFGANPRPAKGKRYADRANCLFVDMDHVKLREAQKQLNKVCSEWEVPKPNIQISSGNGVHFYWRLKNPVKIKEFSEAQKALIHTFSLFGDVVDKAIHDGPRIMRLPGFVNHKGGKIAEIVEIKPFDRYDYCDFLFTFSNLPEDKPAVFDANYQGDNANAIERALKYFSYRDGVGKGQRNSEAFKIAAASMNDFGLTDNDAYHVLSDWNLKCSPPLSDGELGEILKKARGHIGNNPSCSKDRPKPKNYSNDSDRVYKNDKPFIPGNSSDQDGSVNNVYNDKPGDFITADDVDNSVDNEEKEPVKSPSFDMATVAYMVNNYVLIVGTTDVWDLENGILMPLSALAALYPKEIKYWKCDFNRKTILSKNLVFEPSRKLKPGQVNTFRGFDFQQDKRECPLLISHLEMLCGDDDKVFQWVMSWCALQVQKPGTKIATSIIMHGKQGTGKSMFWECFSKIFDPYSIKINQTLLESDFNAWASRKTFILCEEVLANRQKSRLKNVIKDMVTGGSIEINQKFSRPWSEKCYMNMVFLSNNMLPMILDEDDRRFIVIETNNVQDEAYYNKLAEEIKDNGPERLYNFLMNWDLQGFHAHTKPLTTSAKLDLIELTKPTAKIFLDTWLDGEIEELPPMNALKSDLYDAYSTYCKSSAHRVSSRTSFYRTVETDYPEIELRRTASHRYFKLQDSASTNTMQFNELLMKYINKVYNRKT